MRSSLAACLAWRADWPSIWGIWIKISVALYVFRAAFEACVFIGFSWKEDVMLCHSRLPLLAAASLGCAAVCGSAAAGALPESMWNFNPYWPTTAPPGWTGGFSDFEVFLPGDQTAVASTHFNSFYGPGGPGNGPVKTTYNAITDQTTVEFSTSDPGKLIPLGPGSGAIGVYGGDNAVPHFGLSAEVPGETTGGELIPPLNMEWTYGTSGTLTTPTVGVGMSSTGATGPIQYLVEYVTVMSGAESSGNWFELPYQGSYTFNFIGSGGAVTLSDAQYFITPTEIPLGDLNLSDEPPTGSPCLAPSPTSLECLPFTLQPGLDGYLPAFSVQPLPPFVPEPATWATLLLGVLGVGAALRGRGQRIGLHT
jgi:hypothetical protein